MLICYYKWTLSKNVSIIEMNLVLSNLKRFINKNLVFIRLNFLYSDRKIWKLYTLKVHYISFSWITLCIYKYKLPLPNFLQKNTLKLIRCPRDRQVNMGGDWEIFKVISLKSHLYPYTVKFYIVSVCSVFMKEKNADRMTHHSTLFWKYESNKNINRRE